MTDLPHRLRPDTTLVPYWRIFALGLITLLFGIAVLAWPGETLRLLGVLAGVWLIVIGFTRLVSAFRREQGMADQLLSGALGIILIVGGIACLRQLVMGVMALAVIIGLAWILSGFAELLIATMSSGRARLTLVLLGVVSIVAGLIFIAWPRMSLPTVVLLTGISSVVLGVGEAVFAVQQRRAAKIDRRRPDRVAAAG